MKHRVWVVCNTEGHELDAASVSLILQAQGMASSGQCNVDLVVFDEWIASAPAGVRRVYALPSGHDERADSLARRLAALAKRESPSIILACADNWGKSILSVTAGLLSAGLTADCIELACDPDGTLWQTRTAFGGKLLVQIVSRKEVPQMASVQCSPQKAFVQMESPTIVRENIPIEHSGYSKLIEQNKSVRDGLHDLNQYGVMIAGGAGIGSKENFELLYQIAKLMGAGVAASRSAVNLGYAPYSAQVGQSGQAVRPDVYVALGISGAVQHLSGMHHAKRIIAVNHDAKAPIFGYADIAIVCDWRDYAEKLAEEALRIKQAGECIQNMEAFNRKRACGIP